MRWLLLALAACGAQPRHTTPIDVTYLGVAGWQITEGATTILTDPYFSRPPSFEGPIVPDPAAIAAHSPQHADAIVIGHSHVDHLLDAPDVAKRTGAILIGSPSTIAVGAASGLPEDKLEEVQPGDDLEFGSFSIRVIASLHSRIGMPTKQIVAPKLPLTWNDYGDGGTLAYLIRLGGHQILVLDTANFIERELVGIHPDIAILAPGLREKIHDYTCRLIHVLGDPPTVLVTHFDEWKKAPADVSSEDADTFAAELHACSPNTNVIVPKHFQKLTL